LIRCVNKTKGWLVYVGLGSRVAGMGLLHVMALSCSPAEDGDGSEAEQSTSTTGTSPSQTATSSPPSTTPAASTSPPATSSPASSSVPTQEPPAPSGSGGPPAAAGWSREGITCSDLGEPCGGCAEGNICFFSSPAVCVPKASTGGLLCSVGACDVERPYCIDSNCMTLDEAACFCTAEPGNGQSGCDVNPEEHLSR
jgi:hypothetical protein